MGTGHCHLYCISQLLWVSNEKLDKAALQIMNHGTNVKSFYPGQDDNSIPSK